MKKERILLLEREAGVAFTRKRIGELETNLNKLLTLYSKTHNYWDIEVDVWALVENPQQYYDNLLLKNSTIKAVKNFKLDPAKVAETLGVPREKFLQEIQAPVPGTTGQGLRQVVAMIQLHPTEKDLFDYIEGKFIINLTALELLLDKDRVYADTPEKIELVRYFEGVRDMLKEHLRRGFLEPHNLYIIAKSFGLDYGKVDRFATKEEIKLDYKKLAELVIKMR
mgnify:CR=1 FL=1